jgi:hypothetical protein
MARELPHKSGGLEKLPNKRRRKGEHSQKGIAFHRTTVTFIHARIAFHGITCNHSSMDSSSNITGAGLP